jgi:hypothetical protein
MGGGKDLDPKKLREMQSLCGSSKITEQIDGICEQNCRSSYLSLGKAHILLSKGMLKREGKQIKKKKKKERNQFKMR